MRGDTVRKVSKESACGEPMGGPKRGDSGSWRRPVVAELRRYAIGAGDTHAHMHVGGIDTGLVLRKGVLAWALMCSHLCGLNSGLERNEAHRRHTRDTVFYSARYKVR